jgi:hypothetical protein
MERKEWTKKMMSVKEFKKAKGSKEKTYLTKKLESSADQNENVSKKV